jgi:hypothetical protein
MVVFGAGPTGLTRADRLRTGASTTGTSQQALLVMSWVRQASLGNAGKCCPSGAGGAAGRGCVRGLGDPTDPPRSSVDTRLISTFTGPVTSANATALAAGATQPGLSATIA